MKKICYFIIWIGLITGLSPKVSKAQTYSKCIFFYKPYTDSSENNLYIKTNQKFNYNIQYSNLKKANINVDLTIALKHQDYRFIAISGVSYLWPGLMGYIKYNGNKGYGVLNQYKHLLNKYNFKVIYGTSDVIDSSKPDLQGVAFDYALKYNKMLLLKLEHSPSKSH